MLATGISRETLLEIGGVDFKPLLGKEMLQKGGGDLVCFIRQCIRINMLLRLSKMSPEQKELFYKSKLGQEIKRQLQEPDVRKAKITFEMLNYFKKFDPEHFKELYVTATKQEGGLLVYNADTTPSEDIAAACRASASLPVFFRPV